MTRLEDVVDYLTGIKEKNALNVIMIGMLPPLIKVPINWDYRQRFIGQFDSILSDKTIKLTKYVDDIFMLKLKEVDIPYISKFDAFSLEIPKDLIFEGSITYSDNRHISHIGEKIFGRRLIDNLTAQGYTLFNKND